LVDATFGGESGEETIGSLPHTCWRTQGTTDAYENWIKPEASNPLTCGVQRFSSYKCAETAKWKLKQYWFCSIDTWLQGVCQSHCAEHDWREGAMCDGCAGSVFALDGAADEGDESAE
jgi:hypothetical protein